MRIQRLMILGAAMGAISPAMGDLSTLQIDINALSAQASGPLSNDFTGTLQILSTALNQDPNAMMLDLLIDGVRQHTDGATSDQFSFQLDLEFIDGSISDGRLELLVDQDSSENAYRAASVAVVDGSILGFGGRFVIGGRTLGGAFDSPVGTLLGIGVSPWGLAEPTSGSFAIIGLMPDGDGFDPNVDVDVFVVTPTPASAVLMGLGFVVAGHRRR